MGCHTWTFNRIDPQPSYEEVKNWVIENEINSNIRIFSKKNASNFYPDLSKERCDFYLKVLNRQKRMIESGYCKEAVCDRYDHNDKYTLYHNGYFYEEVGNDFLFRVFDYQEDILTSYEQAEKFILDMFKKSTNDKPTLKPTEENVCYTFSAEMSGKILFASEDNNNSLTDPTITLKRTKDFFEKYPNGLIKFG